MTHHDKARELVELVRIALDFCSAAAGEGIYIDGMSPEDFLMRYSDATGFEDWDRIGDHAADLITAQSEENRRLREKIEALPRSTYSCGTQWVRLEQVLAALSSTGEKG